jgi:hypothetical protein
MRLAASSALVAVKGRMVNQSTKLKNSLYNEVAKIKVLRKMVGQSEAATRKFVIYTGHLMLEQEVG